MNKTFNPKYETQIDNKPIWVFDSLSDKEEITSIFNGLEMSAFKRNEVARPDTAEHRHWAVNLSQQQIVNLPLYKRVLDAVEAVSGNRFSAYRGYVNYAAYGDMLFTHTDCLPDAKELTVLVYVCPQWDIEWGGETLFFNTEDDCAFACTPKPGRIIIFDGSIKHVGRPPNRICYASRFTLAFKLELAKQGD
jgi:SM-20-related protein